MKEGDIIDGRYRVQNLLGQGGMGQVYRGQDLEQNKTVAIKVLFPNTPDQVIKRFHTEAKALARLDHPNIMKVMHFGQASNGQLYLIMDFVKGDSLDSIIEKRGPQTFFDVLPIFEKMCRGLRYAHMSNVLHRDIKPSNVMLAVDRSKEEGVKLVDFGLAKQNDDEEQKLTKTGSAMGSPPYMSPESVHGKATDERSDIYSLGCTLFEMIAAVPPFVGDTPFHTMMAQLNRLPPSLAQACGKSFDEEVEEYVQKFLKKSPEARYQNMDEVIADLDSLKNALIEKKRASEGALASGVYASGAWIADKSKEWNKRLGIGVVVAVLVLVIVMPNVWKTIHREAPKASVSEPTQGVAGIGHSPEAAAVEREGEDDLQLGMESYRKGATIRRAKEGGNNICVLSGELTRNELRDAVRPYLNMTCFQLENLNVPEDYLKSLLGFRLEQLVLVKMKITSSFMELVGQSKALVLFRLTDCGALPQGCLLRLKGLQTLQAVDVMTGPDYKNPTAAFAKMPKLMWLTFRDATITREDVKALTTIPLMKVVHFRACTIAPDALIELKAAPIFDSLGITECRSLTKEHFQQIAELKSIKFLSLNATNVNDEDLAKFKTLKNLLSLDVKSTSVSEDGVKALVAGSKKLKLEQVRFGKRAHGE